MSKNINLLTSAYIYCKIRHDLNFCFKEISVNLKKNDHKNSALVTLTNLQILLSYKLYLKRVDIKRSENRKTGESDKKGCRVILFTFYLI